MKQFFLLLKKDFTVEFRGKELLYALLSLSVLISVFFGVGIENAFLERKAVTRIFPLALWVSYIFAATISVSRSLYYEIEFGALSTLLTGRISLASFYVAKVISNTIFNFIAFLFITTALCMFFDLAVSVPYLFPVGLLVSLGYSSLATLTSNMILRTKLRELLLPLILFPLLFPLFFAAHELTMTLIIEKAVQFDSPWAILLILMDLIYLVAGSILFSFAARG